MEKKNSNKNKVRVCSFKILRYYNLKEKIMLLEKLHTVIVSCLTTSTRVSQYHQRQSRQETTQ